MLRIVGLLLATLSLSACMATTGRDFPNYPRDKLVLGQTTKSDVQTIYGEPFEQSASMSSAFPGALLLPQAKDSTAAVQPAMRETLVYFYKRGGNYKKLTLVFINGKLTEYGSGANFPGLATNFDESKVPLLVKGKTTKDETIALLGPPSGMAINPLLPGNTRLQYFYETADGASKDTKSLLAFFDKTDVLMNFIFTSNSKPTPAAPVTPPPFVYIPPITTHHK